MGSYDLGLGLLRQQCLVSIFYTFSHSNAPFAGAEARTRWVTVYGMASGHFFLHPIIFMRYSTCYFYEHSSPDCWSPQERTEDTGRQVGISSLLMKVISSRISNNTQGRLVRLAIPKQKECTEQLYLLVGYCQGILTWSHTHFSFPSRLWIGRTPRVSMPTEHGSFDSPLVLAPRRTTVLVTREPSPLLSDSSAANV